LRGELADGDITGCVAKEGTKRRTQGGAENLFSALSHTKRIGRKNTRAVQTKEGSIWLAGIAEEGGQNANVDGSRRSAK